MVVGISSTANTHLQASQSVVLGASLLSLVEPILHSAVRPPCCTLARRDLVHKRKRPIDWLSSSRPAASSPSSTPRSCQMMCLTLSCRDLVRRQKPGLTSAVCVALPLQAQGADPSCFTLSDDVRAALLDTVVSEPCARTTVISQALSCCAPSPGPGRRAHPVLHALVQHAVCVFAAI